MQYNEYYPYGLQTATSWTRENATGNNFLANGSTELNAITGVYDLHFRNYDPQLGRMNQIDPVASKYASQTPYNYAFNAPTIMNDPLGDDPMFDRDAWRGGARGATHYNPMVKDAGSSGRVGGSVLNPGFSNETWGAIGGTINTMFANTNDFDGYSTWAPGGSINYFSGNGRGLFTERGIGGVMNMLVPEFSYKEWLYPDGSTSLPFDIKLLGFVQQQQGNESDEFLEGFSNLFFSSRINSMFNLRIGWDRIGALSSDTGGKTYEKSFSIIINPSVRNNQTLLFIILDHELVHASDIYNGNLDIWRTMANQLGNPKLADIMMEYHAYLSTQRLETAFGVNYGLGDKANDLKNSLPSQFLNFFNK